MKRLLHTAMVTMIMVTLLVSYEAMAQNSSQGAAQQGTQVVFDKDDLLNAMSDAERLDFLDRRKELKELQEAGRSLKKGSAGRKVVLAEFQAKKTEFDKKFDHLRGFNGKTVMVYGNPPPTKREIMNQVMNGGGFRGGSFGSGLHAHWKRDDSGAIVGGASPPKIKTARKPTAPEVPAAERSTVSPRTFSNNGCTHGIFGIPDDTPECRAAMGR